MFIYTHSTKLSTQPNHHHSASKRRAAFARQAAIAAFGPRAIHALDEPDFEDRKPERAPRHIGQVAAKVTGCSPNAASS